MCANWFSISSAFGLLSELLAEDRTTDFKQNQRHFTRGGPLSPDVLVTLLLYLVADGGRRGYRHLLDAFWDEARDHGIPLSTEEPVSAAAFCKARRKLKPDALRLLLGHVTEAFDKTHGDRHRFNGRRLLAVDGSYISTQRSEELWEAFGGTSTAHNPQIMVSVLHNIVSNVPMDATIAPFGGSEPAELRLLLTGCQPGDVVVLDRGYPSFDLIEGLRNAGIDFVMRVSTKNSFKVVEEFVASGETDCQIKAFDAHRVTRPPLTVRAVRRDGKDSGPQVFLTSLSQTEFTRAKIIRVYQMRWEVELLYRLEKGDYVGQGQFHARTPQGVEQEVLAFMLYVALCRHLMASAAQLHDLKYDQLSQKAAILAVGAYLTRLLSNLDQRVAIRHIRRLLERIARRLEPKRPNRSFPRRSFRPRPRWGPDGRSPKGSRRRRG